MVTTVAPKSPISTPQRQESDWAPLRPEEIADRVVPSDPRISPDGSRVVFVADPVGRKQEKKRSTLWIAEPGGTARKLTAGLALDTEPRWSPDGSRVLFRSDRMAREEDEQRLFLLPLAGGEAQPLGELVGELSQPSWSPDGKVAAVLRRDPVPETVIKARKKDRDDAVVVEEEPRFARLWVVDAETGKRRCLTSGDREVRAYAWAPGGDGLVAVTTAASEYDAVFNRSDLWFVPLTGGLPRQIARFVTTPSNPVVVESDEGPIVAVKCDGGRLDPVDALWTVPLAGGEPRRLIADPCGAVEEVVPLPGQWGKVGARIVERTHARLYAVDVLSGEMSSITPPAFAERGSIAPGVSFCQTGDGFAAVWSDSATPEEVFLASNRGEASKMTSFGAAFAGRLQPAEHVTWICDGVEIEGILTLPHGYEEGRRYPLVVEVHGGPSWQWEDRVMLDWHDWAQMLASHGYAVLMPNPRGSTAYGADFQRLLQDDVGGGESRDLIAGAMAMVERGIADPDRLAIAGWSWGGYLTAWTITQTDIFRAAVMGAGLANMISDHGQGDIPSANMLYYPGQPYHHLEAYWQSSPIRYAANVRTPTLILHGDEDARVHPAQGMEFFRGLKILGVPVRFVRYPREDHGIHERAHQIDLMQRILDWFGRWVMG